MGKIDRGYSVVIIKSIDEEKREITGTATTPQPDRMEDIVEPLGGKYSLPLPLLWQHDQKTPVGHVVSAKVSSSGIDVKCKIAKTSEPGELKNRLDEAWQSIKLGLVRGLSVGFRPIEAQIIKATNGIRFVKWEWLELSLVTIPANVNASISTVKQYAAFGEHENIPGVTGTTSKGVSSMKTIQEQLAALREQMAVKTARLKEIVTTAGEENRQLTGDEGVEFDALEAEIKSLGNDIRKKTVENLDSQTAEPVVDPVRGKAPYGFVKKTKDAEDSFPGQAFTRMVISKAVAHAENISPLVVAQQRWGKTNPQLVEVIRAAVAGGGSGSGEWGAELVAADTRYTGDFIEYLKSKTVYDKLPLREVPANINIKGQDGTATGYWVGQSKPIPVSKADFSSVNLTPLKVAALAVVSNELLRDSSPAAEMLVRDALVDASSQRVDGTFLSTAAASAGVSPAGILNGISAGSSSGNDIASVRADIKALYSGFITAKNANGLYFVMNPALAKALQLMVTDLEMIAFPGISQDGGVLLGDKVVTGDNVTGSHLILLKPSDIYRIGDTGVNVSISREAMIEMDSAPTGASDTPAAASTAMVSMFQTESTAIKVVRSINFAARRASAVAYLNDAAYGDAAS